MIRAHIGYAEELESWINAAEDFELVAPRVLALTTFRYHPKGVDEKAELDRLNEGLIMKINDGGKLYLTQTRVRGKYAIRFNIGQTWTERRHVEAGWAEISQMAATLN